MVDLFVIALIGRWVAKRARAKGYRSLWSAPAMFGYVAGEVLGLTLGAKLGLGALAYGLYLVGGLLGAAGGYLVVARMPPRTDVEALAETFR